MGSSPMPQEFALVVVQHSRHVAVDVFGQAIAEGRDDARAASVLAVEASEKGECGVT